MYESHKRSTTRRVEPLPLSPSITLWFYLVPKGSIRKLLTVIKVNKGNTLFYTFSLVIIDGK